MKLFHRRKCIILKLSPQILRILYKIGLVLIIVFSIVAILVFSKTVYISFLSKGEVFLPIGIGFFFLAPWTYHEADESRKKRGEISYVGLSFCAKSLFMGFIFIFAFVYF